VPSIKLLRFDTPERSFTKLPAAVEEVVKVVVPLPAWVVQLTAESWSSVSSVLLKRLENLTVLGKLLKGQRDGALGFAAAPEVTSSLPAEMHEANRIRLKTRSKMAPEDALI
jgi:hypothetical protein